MRGESEERRAYIVKSLVQTRDLRHNSREMPQFLLAKLIQTAHTRKQKLLWPSCAAGGEKTPAKRWGEERCCPTTNLLAAEKSEAETIKSAVN